MPVVEFEAEDGQTTTVDRPDTLRIIDMCDDLGAPVPFSCRSASCGTCRIDVLEGAALLEPPRDDELDVLELFGDDPARTRLACQARVLAGAGRIRVRVVGESR